MRSIEYALCLHLHFSLRTMLVLVYIVLASSLYCHAEMDESF
jgi:hypothetical protein